MNQTQRKNPSKLAITGTALLLVCLNVAAQNRPVDDDDDDHGDRLQLMLGAGVMNGPKYPGASRSETKALPLIGVRYGRYFVGSAPDTGVPFGLGVNLFAAPNWRVGMVLGRDFDKPREASDDPRLAGLGDIAATTHLGAFGGYSQAWWSVRGHVGSDVGGKHQGTKAGLELEGRYPLTDRVVLSAGPGLVWADQRYTQTFFGVDATQAANSGLARYDAKAGVNSVKFSLGVEYRIDRHWFVSGRAAIESLRGDAKRSPITSETSPHTFGVFGGYRF